MIMLVSSEPFNFSPVQHTLILHMPLVDSVNLWQTQVKPTMLLRNDYFVILREQGNTASPIKPINLISRGRTSSMVIQMLPTPMLRNTNPHQDTSVSQVEQPLLECRRNRRWSPCRPQKPNTLHYCWTLFVIASGRNHVSVYL